VRDVYVTSRTNEMALQRAEMRMVRWMCGIKLKDSVPNKELRERLETDDILQQDCNGMNMCCKKKTMT